MKIHTRTLTKMRYVLNEDCAWVSKDQLEVHDEEKHDGGEE